MMDVNTGITKRPLVELDPDYQEGHDNETKRRCLDEKSGQGEAEQRVVEVVVRELDAALAQKESEALQLQEQVQACQRMLHFLRFGATSTYYKSIFSSEAAADCPSFEGQKAHHPAVLRLMKLPVGSPFGPKTRGISNKLSEKSSEANTDTISFQDGIQDADSKYCEGKEENVSHPEVMGENKSENSKKLDSAPSKIPRYIPPIMPEPPEVCAASVRMERHRIKRRLVIGNVSKWLPEDIREDAASHKWMLYLRGPKDTPDISDIVTKVRYFLHPSYRPHDIVEVNHPFYLTRRGWGEFPVRVQVHFAIPGNRPIDIIHNLKLDRTYSGLQTFGGETVVDVWLKSTLYDHRVEPTTIENTQVGEQKQLTTETLTSELTNQPHGVETHDALDGIVPKQELERKDDIEKESDSKQAIFLEQGQTKVEATEDELQKEEKLQEVKCDESFVITGQIEKGFVFHSLPDHDYLGSNTFQLKCNKCVGQYNSESMHQNKPLKEEQIPSFENIWKPDEEVLRNTENNLCKQASVTGNGMFSNTSLVQCVGTKGNVIRIGLQKPPFAIKHNSKKATSTANNSGVQIPNGVVETNKVLLNPDKYVTINNRTLQNSMEHVSIVPIQAGQSLLKKNCLKACGMPPSLETRTPKTIETKLSNQRKFILGKTNARSQKLVEPDYAAELKESSKVVLKIPDDCQAVTWLLRHLPLTDERVNSVEFKRLHPYCASTKNTFLGWPIGKRHCAERLRAKAAHDILQMVDSSRFAKWSVRHIITWSRLHALTPLSSGECEEPVEQKNLPTLSLRLTLTEPSEEQDWLQNVAEASKSTEEIEDVDIEELGPPSKGLMVPASTNKSGDETVWMYSSVNAVKFLKHTLEQLDIRLVSEALYPGVMYPAVEELLFKAFHSLCEDLLRRSMRQAWKRCKQSPNEIVLCDVQNALLTRPEFDIFTNVGLGTQAYVAK